MDILLGDIDELKGKLRREINVEKDQLKLPESKLPKAVKKYRQAKIKHKLYRQKVLAKARAGDNHYKRRRKKRNEERWKWERDGQLEYKRKLYADPRRRYKEVVRRNWKPYVSPELLAECMSEDEYVWLMAYTPERLYELSEGVIVDSNKKNISTYLANNNLISNSYPNTNKLYIDNTFHKIVRLDTSKSYTLDNILVIDKYSNLVYYKPTSLVY